MISCKPPPTNTRPAVKAGGSGKKHMLHQLTTADTGAPAMWCWITADGDPILIGEHDAIIALDDAITLYLGGVVGEPIHDTDPAWGNSFDIGAAVAEAQAHGYTDNQIRLADTIRAACRAGRIRGATQTQTGRWLIPRRTFRHWLMSYRPKPRN